MSVEKVSVSLDAEVLAEARLLAGPGGLSQLVGEALARQVKLERLGALLEDDAREFGPVPEELREAVRAEWPA